MCFARILGAFAPAPMMLTPTIQIPLHAKRNNHSRRRGALHNTQHTCAHARTHTHIHTDRQTDRHMWRTTKRRARSTPCMCPCCKRTAVSRRANATARAHTQTRGRPTCRASLYIENCLGNPTVRACARQQHRRVCVCERERIATFVLCRERRRPLQREAQEPSIACTARSFF